MFEYRQLLVRMHQGDSDRSLSRAGLIGRTKTKVLRELADHHGWLNPGYPLPEDGVLAKHLISPTPAISQSCVELFRDASAMFVKI